MPGSWLVALIIFCSSSQNQIVSKLLYISISCSGNIGTVYPIHKENGMQVYVISSAEIFKIVLNQIMILQTILTVCVL